MFIFKNIYEELEGFELLSVSLMRSNYNSITHVHVYKAGLYRGFFSGGGGEYGILIVGRDIN